MKEQAAPESNPIRLQIQEGVIITWGISRIPNTQGSSASALRCGRGVDVRLYVPLFPEDVIGKTVVIHDRPDDFHTQPSGDSGEKIACGKIVAEDKRD